MTGTEWGEWDALPGENPDDCLRSQNADHITQISNVVTPGAITDGVTERHRRRDHRRRDHRRRDHRRRDHRRHIAYGDITSGAVTANGTAKVFVNGKAL